MVPHAMTPSLSRSVVTQIALDPRAMVITLVVIESIRGEKAPPTLLTLMSGGLWLPDTLIFMGSVPIGAGHTASVVFCNISTNNILLIYLYRRYLHFIILSLIKFSSVCLCPQGSV